MSEFFGSVWWLLVTLGLLVTFHEFGHFWVARRCGVKVLRFSIGFGKALWSRRGRDGTEYVIAAIPLGGYVKFLDAREADNPDEVGELPGEYNAAPVWQRMAIAAAGPVFNILFTIVAFWAMFVVGRPDFQPVIGTPQGLAAQAGLQNGDRILAVDGDEVDSWSAAMVDIAQAAMVHSDARIQVDSEHGGVSTHVLKLSQLQGEIADDSKTFDRIGLNLRPIPAIADSVPAGPAREAGVHPGDRIISINGHPVDSFDAMAKLIAEQAAQDPLLRLRIQRDQSTIGLDVTAQKRKDGKQSRWIIGIGGRNAYDAVEHYGPVRAISAAVHETWKTASSTLGMIGSMLTGQASTKNLSSVISIAQVANQSAHMGLAWFLSFLAQISLALGILNLLPIPILDGGHLVYYLIELVKGRPLSDRALIAGQFVGMALLVMLMGLAFYNDILRLVTG